MTQTEAAMNRLLRAMEDEGRQYGLKLNKSKCEYLYFGGARPVQFGDGTAVPIRSDVKDLGSNLNDQGDPAREVNRRIRDCMATLSKLHIFFQHADNTIIRKLMMFNAIIRSKLMYGLETL